MPHKRKMKLDTLLHFHGYIISSGTGLELDVDVEVLGVLMAVVVFAVAADFVVVVILW